MIPHRKVSRPTKVVKDTITILLTCLRTFLGEDVSETSSVHETTLKNTSGPAGEQVRRGPSSVSEFEVTLADM